MWRPSWITLASIGLLGACSGRSEGAPRQAREVELTEAATFSEAGEAGPITLHLDWPDGARGRVETSRTVERTGMPESGRASARYRIAIGRRGSEITARTSELVLRPPRGGPGETLNGVLVLATFLPSARFTSDIEALSLVDAERTAELFRSALLAATDEEVRAMPAWQSMAPLLDGAPAMLTQQASGVLSPIATLDGIPVTRGQLVTVRDRRRTSDGEDAEQSTMTTLLGSGPCFEGDDAGGCVSLEVTAHYGAEALAGAAGPGPASIRSIDGTLRMLVEPTTLLPHRLDATKETVFLAPGGDGLEELRETETLTWHFRWERLSIRD